jgi:hypothetical protein
MEDGILPEEEVKPLWREATELTSIFLASIKTVRGNSQ